MAYIPDVIWYGLIIKAPLFLLKAIAWTIALPVFLWVVNKHVTRQYFIWSCMLHDNLVRYRMLKLPPAFFFLRFCRRQDRVYYSDFLFVIAKYGLYQFRGVLDGTQ